MQNHVRFQGKKDLAKTVQPISRNLQITPQTRVSTTALPHYDIQEGKRLQILKIKYLQGSKYFTAVQHHYEYYICIFMNYY